MFLWPRITPGRVSTSISFSDSRWCRAKLRTCSWAKRMSSRSLPATSDKEFSISDLNYSRQGLHFDILQRFALVPGEVAYLLLGEAYVVEVTPSNLRQGILYFPVG